MDASHLPYTSYDDVPWYRKHGPWWALYLFAGPVALLILITGDVYYLRNGELRSFGPLNRIAAGLIATACGTLYGSILVSAVIDGMK